MLLFSLIGGHTLERKVKVINEDWVSIILNYLLKVKQTLNHIKVF